MPIPINPPPRVPRPRGTALTSYFELDTSSPSNSGVETRWAFDGVTFVPYACGTEVNPLTVDPCADDGDDFINTPMGFETEVTFPAFGFEISIQCSLLSMTGDDLRKQLTVLVENELSPIFGEQVYNGIHNPAAPSLASDADILTEAGATNPFEAVGLVEDGLADRIRDAVGMIHVPPSIMFEIAQSLDFSDGRFHTPTGHIVVADPGYQGGAPTSGTEVGGFRYVYGSSPVHFKYMTPMFYGDDFENWITTHNDQVVRVAGYGIAVWEPCSVVAARVSFA